MLLMLYSVHIFSFVPLLEMKNAYFLGSFSKISETYISRSLK